MKTDQEANGVTTIEADSSRRLLFLSCLSGSSDTVTELHLKYWPEMGTLPHLKAKSVLGSFLFVPL